MNKITRFVKALLPAMIATVAIAMVAIAAPPARPVIPNVPQPATIVAVPEGETVLKGTIVVIRIVDHDGLVEDIQGGTLVSDVVAGPDGLVSVDIWKGFRSEKKAERDALKQYIADWKTANCQGPEDPAWNWEYEILFFGEEVDHQALACE